MAGRVADKVAVITGAGRGQGRAHSLSLAAEGADIVAIDFATSYDTLNYDMSSKEDLEETGRLVEALGRRALTIQADVRDYSAIQQAVRAGLAEFGRIDIVSPGAGISAMAPAEEQGVQHWIDTIDVNLSGVTNTINATLPHLQEGASIVVTGSVGALMKDGPSNTPGGHAYTFAKRNLISLVRTLASVLAPMSIRVNGIHPTNCNTPMLLHQDMFRLFRPDVDDPTLEDALVSFPVQQSMPVPWVEPEEISSLLLFLSSDEARHITGQFIAVDAGASLKF